MKLPRTILMYPMTLISQAAHLVMHFQQNIAELAIKGDATLETLFPPKEEQPEWATFDEDMVGVSDGTTSSEVDAADSDRRAEGRFALYSVPDAAKSRAAPDDGPDQLTQPLPAARAKKSAPKQTVLPPAAAVDLDYQALTLAQLRARLPSLNVGELEALLSYEQATKARAPFQTLLANRITRATAK
jgi:hypothetical protein